jgi:endonuclease-8
MPEGDTLARAAETLRQWLVGRTITRVDARDVGLKHRAQSLVGRDVDSVEARAKHLLITIGDRVIHSHMKMTGSWHVYATGERWKKSPVAMRLVLEAGDRTAVCFNAPVVQIVNAKDLGAVPGLNTLGPDILVNIDPVEGAKRLRTLPPSTPAGDALLDQTAVSGLGNIWRCEALWVERVHPAARVEAIDDDTLAALVRTGAALMGAAANRSASRPPPQVYKRSGQPCRRCGTPITSQRMGKDNRTAYWCPTCQQVPNSSKGIGY